MKNNQYTWLQLSLVKIGHDNVSFRIEEQGDGFQRGGGEEVYVEGHEFYFNSSSCPEIRCDDMMLYVRGTDRAKDSSTLECSIEFFEEILLPAICALNMFAVLNPLIPSKEKTPKEVRTFHNSTSATWYSVDTASTSTAF